MRISRTFNDFFTLLNHLTIVNQDALILADQEFVIGTFIVGNHQTLFALSFLTESYRTRHFSEHTGILRRTSFKQLGNTRQTTRNITGLLRFNRNTSQDFTAANLLTVADHNQSTDRQLNRHTVIRSRNLHFVAIFIEQTNSRTQRLRATLLTLGTTGRRTFRVNHHEAGQTSHFVGLTHHGYVVNDAFKLNRTTVFGNNRTGHRIPGCQLLASLDLLIGLREQRCTVGYFMAFTFTTVIADDDFTGTRNHNEIALGARHITHRRGVAHLTVNLGFHRACHRSTASGTTDVERTHRQLCTRFTNGLSCDHAHSLTDIDQGATAQITTIALGAQTVTGLAGKRRANHYFVNTEFFNFVAFIFGQERTGRNNDFSRFRIDDIGACHTTQHTVTQRLNNVTTFNQGLHADTLSGVAVFFSDDQVLRHVNETTS